MRRRLLSILLCTAMTVTMFTGCGNLEVSSGVSDVSDSEM